MTRYTEQEYQTIINRKKGGRQAKQGKSPIAHRRAGAVGERLRRPKYRSKWEEQYAERLERDRKNREIDWWAYECIRLKIGAEAWYTPDFITRVSFLEAPDIFEFHEVKGYKREAAMVRLKAAALMYPFFTFFLVTKKGSRWTKERIG